MPVARKVKKFPKRDSATQTRVNKVVKYQIAQSSKRYRSQGKQDRSSRLRRRKVARGIIKSTGSLTAAGLKYNRFGNLVSRKASNAAKARYTRGDTPAKFMQHAGNISAIRMARAKRFGLAVPFKGKHTKFSA